ncbi:hypothetical protein KL938_005275 [Ogataea parapolymorpha]|nr:hypothetical protein KL938_005275 [Ogataea parapolymorpha]
MLSLTSYNITAAGKSSVRYLSLTSDLARLMEAKPLHPVVVVGGGHAGVEAAAGSARTGVFTTLVTPDISKIGVTSCNPAFGRHRKRYTT